MVLSAGLVIFNWREVRLAFDRAWVLPVLGSGVGYPSGLIGVGGGVQIVDPFVE